MLNCNSSDVCNTKHNIFLACLKVLRKNKISVDFPKLAIFKDSFHRTLSLLLQSKLPRMLLCSFFVSLSIAACQGEQFVKDLKELYSQETVFINDLFFIKVKS